MDTRDPKAEIGRVNRLKCHCHRERAPNPPEDLLHFLQPAFPGHWVVGGLVTNVWNMGNGYDDAPDVNQMMIQPFVNYNMDKGWYVSFSPVMTANWEADSGDQWTVPLGAGVGRVFKIGSQHVNMRASGYYNVQEPGDDHPWNLQLMCIFLFPK